MKTSELTGAALDWAVAKCEGGVGLWYDAVATWWTTINGKDRALSKGWAQSFTPSTDWSQGGPIIEREKISLRPDYWDNGGCRAFIDRGGSAKNTIGSMHAPTPLIAAMRCYVASKLGDEVDVPEELK